jgi:hydroxymethylbilane synthase
MVASVLLRIGTRGSPLALWQANEVKTRLERAWTELARPGAVEIVPIKTTGDRITDRSLADEGGKGLFTKEIEEALLAKDVDVAVHSMKDLPTALPKGLTVPAILPREDPNDVLIADPEIERLADLPEGATVGTSSPRRKAQLLARRPDLVVVELRGNVETRLRRIAQGRAQATLLALAGLRRLGLIQHTRVVLPTEEMLPAAAQGAVGVECRADDTRVVDFLAPLHSPTAGHEVTAERALLDGLGGSCRTPIAALGRDRTFGRLRLDALIAKPDGSAIVRTSREGSVSDASAMGLDAADELKATAGPGFF